MKSAKQKRHPDRVAFFVMRRGSGRLGLPDGGARRSGRSDRPTNKVWDHPDSFVFLILEPFQEHIVLFFTATNFDSLFLMGRDAEAKDVYAIHRRGLRLGGGCREDCEGREEEEVFHSVSLFWFKRGTAIRHLSSILTYRFAAQFQSL